MVSLPNEQTLSPEIVPNTENTIFTVNEASLYRMAYYVNIVSPDSFFSEILVNRAPFYLLSKMWAEILTALHNLSAGDYFFSYIRRANYRYIDRRLRCCSCDTANKIY